MSIARDGQNLAVRSCRLSRHRVQFPGGSWPQLFLPPQQSPPPDLWPKNDEKRQDKDEGCLLPESLRPSSYSRKIRLPVASAYVATEHKLIEIMQGTNRNGLLRSLFLSTAREAAYK